MIKSALYSAGPVVASAGLYGVGSSQIGTALIIIMALAVIANQLWTLFDKARRAIRNPETSTAGFASRQIVDQRHRQIEAALAGLKAEDARQHRINKEQFQTVTVALGEMKREMREDIKGLHKRSDDVLRAVSRLEGKVN